MKPLCSNWSSFHSWYLETDWLKKLAIATIESLFHLKEPLSELLQGHGCWVFHWVDYSKSNIIVCSIIRWHVSKWMQFADFHRRLQKDIHWMEIGLHSEEKSHLTSTYSIPQHRRGAFLVHWSIFLVCSTRCQPEETHYNGLWAFS